MKRTILAACAASLLVPASAFAADRKVPTASFPTIAAAVAAANAGDRILVGPGSYPENVVTSVPNLQFIGRHAIWDGTLTTGAAGTCLTSTGGGTVVQGFVFRNGAGAQVSLSGANCKVTKCDSRNARGFLVVNGTGALVQSCRVFESLSSGNAGIDVSGNTAVVDRCRVQNSDSRAIRVTGNDATVRNCIVLQIEDDKGIHVVGDRARVLSNKVSNVDTEGVLVTGNAAVVTGNGIANTTTHGISVAGTNASVSKNTVRNAGIGTSTAHGILVAGDGAIVSQNKVSATNGDGIQAAGANATVDRNVVTETGGSGILVNGNNPHVTANRVSVTVDDASGFNIVTDGNNTQGLVEGNTASDCVQHGFSLTVTKLTVRKNSAARCGTEAETGFLLTGANNALTDDTAIACGSDGFRVIGDGNTLVRCIASFCYADGFDIQSGTGNVVNACRATACDGEGIDNGGTNTNVIASFFTKNRLDVASDGTFLNAGSFATDNTFSTGGTAQLPQVN